MEEVAIENLGDLEKHLEEGNKKHHTTNLMILASRIIW